MPQSEKTKQIIRVVVLTTVTIVSSFLVQHFFFKKPSFDKQLMEAASELNKTCPMMVDSETQLDNAIALPNNVFQYNYTMINLSKEEVDTTEAHKLLDQGIINNVKTSPDLNFQRQ